MFQTTDSIGILKENEDIASLKLALDSSDAPVVAWAEDTGGGYLLKAAVKSGSEWVLTDDGREVSLFEGEYSVLMDSDSVHFAYVVKTAGPSDDLAVRYASYDRSTAVLSDALQIASGDVGACLLFYRSSTLYVAYVDGTTVKVVDASGTPAFTTGLASVSFTSGATVRISASGEYLLVGAAYESSGTATPEFWLVDLAGDSLVGNPDMGAISDIDDFDFSIAYNAFGDSGSPITPDATYLPFHVVFAYRNGSAFSVLVASIAEDSTLAVVQYYDKTVADYDDVHDESITTDMAVDDLDAFVTVKLGNLHFFNSTNIIGGASTKGFDSNSNVGRNGATGFGSQLSSGNLHFAYAWDGNISYGHEPCGSAGSSIEREFVVAESSVWVDGWRRTELNRRLFHIPIYDEDQKVAGLCWVSQDLSCRLKMYDVETRDFIYDFSGGKLGYPVHGVYDRRNARILVCDVFRIYGGTLHRGGSIVIFDVTDGTVERYESFGNHVVFEPRAIALTSDLVVIADTGNHRIALLNRDDLSLNRVVELDGMRFPHGLAAGVSGELLVKCFDDELMTPELLHVDGDDNIVQKLPAAHKMGWDDVCGDLLPGAVFVLEGGRESEAGVHVVNQDGTTIMQKRLTVQTPLDYSVGNLFGDMMVIYEDDVVGGFSPAGKENGFATVSGASDGFLVPRHLDRSFLLVVPGDVTTSFTDLRNDVASATLKAERCSTVEFVPTVAYCLYYSGNAVMTDGTTTARYDSKFNDTIWEKTYSFTITQIEENEYQGILIYLTGSDSLVVADALTGDVVDTFDLEADYFRYCHRKGWLYAVNGEVVTRYDLQATSSSSGLSFALVKKSFNTVDRLVDIAVQEGTDRLWVATEHKLHKYNLSTIEQTDTELWDSIQRLLPLNYPTAVYNNDEFDCSYSVKYSSSTEKFVAASEGTGQMVTVGEGTNWFTIFDSDYSIQGVDIDGMTGDVYITDDSTDTPRIIRVDKYGDTETDSETAPAAGDIMVYDNDSEDLRGNFIVLSPPEYSTGSLTADFHVVSESGSAIPWIESDDTENPELTFGWVEPDNSRHLKEVPVDVWHLNHTGLQGTKISVDNQFSFNEYEKGELRRVPVFSWDFDWDDPSDTLLTTSGTSFLRFSVVYGTLSALGGGDLEDDISCCLLFDDKIALVSLGVLYIYEFLSTEFISSVFVVDDLKIFTARNNHLWCGSLSRGEVYKIQVDDLSRFSTFEANDAPIGMQWMEAEQKFVLVSQNSVQYMDEDGDTTPVYNCEEHTIVDFDVKGDYIALAFQHYDAVPFSDEYEDEDEFQSDLYSRKRDKVVVIDRSNFRFAYDRGYDAEVRAESVEFGNNDVLYLVSRRIVSSGSQYLVVDEIPLLGGDIASSEVATTSPLIRTVFMPESDMLVNVMRDGTSVEFMSDTGSITSVKRFEARVGSACGYTAMPETIARTLNRTYTDGSSSSSSGSSGSTLANVGNYDAVQIIVGDTPGGSNRWNSGIVPTNKRSLLYGGGNNLEPGQRYYVSVRVRRGDVWGTYSTTEFVMGHFDNFPLVPSSSSSSSATCRVLGAGDVVDLGQVVEQCVFLDFSGAQTAYIVINGVYYAVGWGSPVPVWDFGSPEQYTFSTIGETITRSASGYFYSLTWTSQYILSFVQAASSSSSSSSSSYSSSSYSSSSYSSSSSSSNGSISSSSQSFSFSSSPSSSQSFSFSSSPSSSQSFSFSSSPSSSQSFSSSSSPSSSQSFSSSSSPSSSQSFSSSSSPSSSQSFSSSPSSSSSQSYSLSSSSSSWEYLDNNYSVEFDGFNDMVSLGSNLRLDKDGSTIALWFRAPTGVYQNAFMGHSTNGDFIDLDTDTQISMESGVWAMIWSAPFDVADGNWHLLVLRRNGNSDNRIYVDGVESPSGAKYSASDTVLNQIGRIGSNFEWQGNIDEVAVWNKALSSAERDELYASECPTNLLTHSAAANLTNWWRMGDGDVYPTITDVIGGNNGTMTNMTSGDIVADVPTCLSSSSSTSTSASSSFSSSSSFTGSRYSTEFSGSAGERVQVSDHATISLTDDFSVIAHVKTSSVSGYEWAVCKSEDSDRGWMLGVNGSTGKMAAFVFGNASGSTLKEYESSITVNDGDWHQIGFNFNGGTLKLFVDGAEDTSPTKTTDDSMSTVNDSADDLFIGASHSSGASYSDSFDGKIDQATVWGRALTTSEFNEAYNGGCPEDLSTHSRYFFLNAWWGMGDYDTYPTISDLKNSNDGTMIGMSADDFVTDTGCY